MSPRLTGLAGVAAGLAVALRGVQLGALKAAGIQTIPPAGGNVFEQLIRTLEGNLDWLIVTVIGLVLTALVALLLFGSQRAPDHLFRVLGAIAVLIVGIPALLK